MSDALALLPGRLRVGPHATVNMAVIVRKTEMVAIVLTAHAGTMAVIVAVAAQAAMEMSVHPVVCIGPQVR
jgi:hypothetical protein